MSVAADRMRSRAAAFPAASSQRVSRIQRGRRADACGRQAEEAACIALEQDGWTVRGRRLRTPAGEIDVAAEKNGTLALIEVKARQTLTSAAYALTARQMQRLIAAGDILIAEHPDWGQA